MDLRIRPLRFRDRRVAAADQLWDDSHADDSSGVARGRILAPMDDDERDAYREQHPGGPRYIYSWHTAPFRDPTQRGDLRRLIERQRSTIPTRHITRIVLHQTAGHAFTASDLPGAETDGDIHSHHRVDEIIAHFIVMQDGTVVYTHDVAFGLNDAGGAHGIDIEFAGHFAGDTRHATARLSEDAILAGRALIYCLTEQIDTISTIHPHGQFQANKRRSCPGPDVWVNVGLWAINHPTMRLTSRSRGHTIHPAQEDPAYDLHITRRPEIDSDLVDPWL